MGGCSCRKLPYSYKEDIYPLRKGHGLYDQFHIQLASSFVPDHRRKISPMAWEQGQLLLTTSFASLADLTYTIRI